MNKIKAYKLQDAGADTVEANERLGFGADMRDYSILVPMIEHLGVSEVRLMTNNPRKIVGLEGFGIEVVERVPMRVSEHEDTMPFLAERRAQLLATLMPMRHAAVRDAASPCRSRRTG